MDPTHDKKIQVALMNSNVTFFLFGGQNAMKHLAANDGDFSLDVFAFLKALGLCDPLCYAGEHRESREDGANHQRVPNSQQQMGSDLLLVQREDRSVYTGRVTARISLTKTQRHLLRREKQSVTRRVGTVQTPLFPLLFTTKREE